MDEKFDSPKHVGPKQVVDFEKIANIGGEAHLQREAY